jgi:hypothetical protein
VIAPFTWSCSIHGSSTYTNDWLRFNTILGPYSVRWDDGYCGHAAGGYSNAWSNAADYGNVYAAGGWLTSQQCSNLAKRGVAVSYDVFEAGTACGTGSIAAPHQTADPSPGTWNTHLADCGVAAVGIVPLGVANGYPDTDSADNRRPNPLHRSLDAGMYEECPSDTTAPVVTVPQSMVVEATSPAGAAATFTVSATDPDDEAGPVTCDHATGSTFPIGTTTVSCSSTDTHGNVGTASFTIAVRDTTAPSPPAGLLVTDGSRSNAVTIGWTPSTDAVGVTSYHVSLDGRRQPDTSTASATLTGLDWGTHSVVVEAFDAAGNHSADATLTVSSSWR